MHSDYNRTASKPRGFLPAVLLIPLLTLFPGPLTTAPVPPPYDAMNQVNFMQSLLSERKDSYKLFLADPFENTNTWKSYSPSVQLANVRYIYKAPLEPAFAKEKGVIEFFARATLENQQSLFVHTNFNIPGRQSFTFYPREPIILTGQLLRASVWIHSNNYLHNLYFLFRNADGRKIRVPIGGLTWHGWRRIAVTLPRALYRRGRRPRKRYEHRFIGFQIKSHPKQPAGDVALLFDNLIVIADMKEFIYPGALIRDSW